VAVRKVANVVTSCPARSPSYLVEVIVKIRQPAVCGGQLQSEGAKFWLGIMNELNHLGLKGYPEAISVVYPDSEIQTCFVHLVRNLLSFCNWKDRKPVTAELKKICNAETAEPAAKRLEDF
jgi:transposase-like protein